jgi:hypothetical protein
VHSCSFPNVALRASGRSVGLWFAQLEGSRGILIPRLQPSLFPEKQAGSLAASVGLSIASKVEMNTVRQRPVNVLATNRIASLVSTLIDLKTLTTIVQHLRHQGQSFKPAICVKSGEDLLLATDFNPIAGRKDHDFVPLTLLVDSVVP